MEDEIFTKEEGQYIAMIKPICVCGIVLLIISYLLGSVLFLYYKGYAFKEKTTVIYEIQELIGSHEIN